MSFEDSILRNVERDQGRAEKLSPAIEKAHTRTQDIFKREAIDMDAFRQSAQGGGIYPDAEVEADMMRVKDLKKKFRLQETEEQEIVHMKASVAEGLIYRGISKYGWFPQARAIKTAEYDDFVNGIDIMAEFGDDGRIPQNVMGLMIDVTFSGNALEKKFGRIKKEIREGHLATIKYFHSRTTPALWENFLTCLA
ncbi:MAG: hypothetical protein WDN67_02135 [Candidatus Moraniibacteriota bacterium]